MSIFWSRLILAGPSGPVDQFALVICSPKIGPAVDVSLVLLHRLEVQVKMKTRYTEAQIVFALRQAEAGTPVSEVIRKMGVAEQTFYRWKKKYAGLGVPEVRTLDRQIPDLFSDRRKILYGDRNATTRAYRGRWWKYHFLCCAAVNVRAGLAALTQQRNDRLQRFADTVFVTPTILGGGQLGLFSSYILK